jgi:K+-transporting ATPase ATPase C chain
MKDHLLPAIRITLVLIVLVCGIYPGVVWAIGQLLFPDKANGSLITRDGRVVGSSLIGQSFAADRYFHSRPGRYDAGASGGSNLGPTSRKLAGQIEERVLLLRGDGRPRPPILAQQFAASATAPDSASRPGSAGAAQKRRRTTIPADAVTASGSGLDPHISPANARMQAARVARARGIPVDDVDRLITARTEGRFLGVFGEPRVNVLLLNLELDRVAGAMMNGHAPTS